MEGLFESIAPEVCWVSEGRKGDPETEWSGGRRSRRGLRTTEGTRLSVPGGEDTSGRGLVGLVDTGDREGRDSESYVRSEEFTDEL